MTTLILKQENSSFCRELYHKNKSQFDMFSKKSKILTIKVNVLTSFYFYFALLTQNGKN